MAGNVSDFMKLWTQSDQASERRLQKFLLVGLDKVVQGQSDVLSKIPVGTAANRAGGTDGWKNGVILLKLLQRFPETF